MMENLNYHKLHHLHRVALIYHAMTLNGSTTLSDYPIMIQMEDQRMNFKRQSTLLPILLESVNSPALVRHCIEIIKQLTQHLKQLQKHIVITGDQSVYALGKKVRWMFPDQFRDIL